MLKPYLFFRMDDQLTVFRFFVLRRDWVAGDQANEQDFGDMNSGAAAEARREDEQARYG